MTHDRKKELRHQLPSEKAPLTAAFCLNRGEGLFAFTCISFIRPLPWGRGVVKRDAAFLPPHFSCRHWMMADPFQPVAVKEQLRLILAVLK
jgi:hypothetical protein